MYKKSAFYGSLLYYVKGQIKIKLHFHFLYKENMKLIYIL